jgi:hypothetical protein
MLDRLAKYNVVWDSPSKDASGSMPLGNGDIGINVWVESGGDLMMLIGKSDAWDENCSLLKLGRVRLKLSPNPFVEGTALRQTLDLATATIEVIAGAIAIRIWVDISDSLIRVEAQSGTPFQMQAQLEVWRTQEYAIKTQTSDLFKNLTGKDPFPTVVSPDIILSAENQVVWCHRNQKREQDGYEINMRLQGLGALLHQMPHPLAGRAFGGMIDGDGFVSVDATSLKSAAANRHELSIHIYSRHPATLDEWRQGLNESVGVHRNFPIERSRQLHELWWKQFWERSWIFVDLPDVFHITQSYILQRFMNACAGRGAMPIKHNGSIFSYGKLEDPDFRRWGGPGFWFMNQRLIYWPMLASGDWDLLLRWLWMYRQTLDMQCHRTRTYFGHGGAHFPETIMFWGAEVSAHYGWTPFEQRARPEAECPYLTYYWSGGIELTLILLEYYAYTQDAKFAQEMLLPIADAVTEFFDLHYPRDAKGKIRFEPAQALETWHEATNPLPEIAALRYTLMKLLDVLSPLPVLRERVRVRAGRAEPSSLPSPRVPGEGESLLERWTRLMSELPELPIGEKDGKRVILPAERFDKKKNTENPELYSIFPYRIHGVGKPELELARHTFAARLHQSHECWSQDDIQMALLGLTDQAKQWITWRAAPEQHSDSRFPAFWNAHKDWCPDIDHGGVLQLALQFMLMQCEGQQIRLLPAWPKEWNVEFKLHAPFQTVVEANVRDGEVIELKVTPESRRADVVFGA